jgi:hypothetical protein
MTDTPIALISRFETAARKDFEDRLANERRRYLGYLTGAPRGGEAFDVRRLAAELMALPDTERHTLLHRVSHRDDGPASLEGLEALGSFIATYMLDDGECMVAPEPVPRNLDDDPYFSNLLAFMSSDDEHSEVDAATRREHALLLYAKRERPLVVLPCDGTAAAAGPAEILAAIGHNRELERRREAEFADFMADGSDGPATPGGP